GPGVTTTADGGAGGGGVPAAGVMVTAGGVAAARAGAPLAVGTGTVADIAVLPTTSWPTPGGYAVPASVLGAIDGQPLDGSPWPSATDPMPRTARTMADARTRFMGPPVSCADSCLSTRSRGARR